MGNEAAGEPDGLAVLGMFLEVGEKHEEFDKVCKLLDKIKFKGDKVSFEEPSYKTFSFAPLVLKTTLGITHTQRRPAARTHYPVQWRSLVMSTKPYLVQFM